MLNDCHDNANCTDIPGSYVCECVEGYQGNGTACESMSESSEFFHYMHFMLCCFVLLDIDECQNETLNNCDDNAECFDTDGSFDCVCREGYSGTGVACQGIILARFVVKLL